MSFFRNRRKLGWLAFALFGLLVAAAWGTAFSGSVWLHYLFSPMCHQHAERCFHMDGTPWPLCVRCIAIYSGLAIGGAIFGIWNPKRDFGWFWLCGALSANLVDFGLERVGAYDNLFATRIGAGLFLGVAIAFFCLSRMPSRSG